MWIHISPGSRVPIYVQIVEQLKQAITGGLLESGEQLPSVRELALKLTVNPNTVARAYQELEREGYIDTLSGRGTFVRGDAGNLPADKREAMVREAMLRAVLLGKNLGYGDIELVALLSSILKEEAAGGEIRIE